MRIGIFETEHFEGAYPVIKLFDNGKNDITVFTYAKPYRQFQFLFAKKADKLSWVVRQENESKYRFVYRMYKDVRRRKIRLLYLNTISDNHVFYAWLIRLLPGVRVIVTIHNVNNYFFPRSITNFRQLVRASGKKSLVAAVKEFNVVSVTIVPYLQSLLPAHKKVHCVPGAVYEGVYHEVAPPTELKTIRLVVPGTVDVRRRDYEVVFELLEHCNRLSLPVSITLLGGHYGDAGKQILEKCRQYKQQKDNLIFYETDIVDQPEFDRVMNESHFVFIPTQVETVLSDGIPETYGKSSSSGNLFDIIKHAKPFISPTALALPEDLQAAALRYEDMATITAFLQMITQDATRYKELAKKAILSSENYTIVQLREKNPTLFEDAV